MSLYERQFVLPYEEDCVQKMQAIAKRQSLLWSVAFLANTDEIFWSVLQLLIQKMTKKEKI